MSIQKRTRGRPKDTGKDDGALLAAVADMLTANPSMRPTTAMRRVAGRPSDADVRRFQEKWKSQREALLEAAASRLQAKAEAKIAEPRRGADRDASSMRDLVRDIINSPTMRLAREINDSPTMRLARELNDSPAMRLAREINDSPAMRLAREIQNSPAMRIARELENSPALRAARALENSPTMRAVLAARKFGL